MDEPLDYSHRFHVGNHGDVWKHVALVRLLDAAPSGASFLDTHAGEGGYTLGHTGEWTAGIGKLWVQPPASGPVRRYLDVLSALGAGPRTAYPGSPLLAKHLVGDALGDRLVLHEIQDDAAAALRKHVGPGAQIHTTSGFAAAPSAGPLVVHVDPPYVARDDWTRAPDAFAALLRDRPDAMGILWYPIKSWSRPNVLLGRLRDSGVPFVALDLIVTPLELKRPQLAGSGVALVGAPPEVVADLCAVASVLGPALATHGGRWSLRVSGG